MFDPHFAVCTHLTAMKECCSRSRVTLFPSQATTHVSSCGFKQRLAPSLDQIRNGNHIVTTRVLGAYANKNALII